MIWYVGYGVLLAALFGVQIFFVWVWNKSKDHDPGVYSTDFPAVTILIPVRNESGRISRCLQSLVDQNYPRDLVQILVIDDHSTDHTVDEVYMFPNVGILHLEARESGKKKAIHLGVKHARNDIILTIDGDCRVEKNWLATMAARWVDSEVGLVAGPVWMVPENSTFIQKFQELEQAALNVLTFSGLHTGLVLSANGANMGYRKSQYLSANPYDDNQHLVSGDDVFFAQKVVESGERVDYVQDPEALVFTSPVPSFQLFIQQRLRWAGKSSDYSHRSTQLYLGLFGIVNILLAVLFFVGLWMPKLFTMLLIGLFVKFVVDYVVIQAGMRWGCRPVCWQDILKASLFQVVYVNYVLVLLATGRKTNWKGRTVGSGSGPE